MQKLLALFAFFCCPLLAGYNYSRSITIDHTKCGSANSTNFPVLVAGTYSYLATVANGGNVTSASGYDIIFTSDSAGTILLNFERASFNATTGAVEFWVKVPTVSNTADTVIYLFYGNSAVTTDQSAPVATWSNGFLLVMHMEGGPTDSLGAYSAANTGTPPTYVNGGLAGSKIGKYAQNSGGGGNGITITDTGTLSPTPLTVSAWVEMDTFGPVLQTINSTYNPTTGQSMMVRNTAATASYIQGSAGTRSVDPSTGVAFTAAYHVWSYLAHTYSASAGTGTLTAFLNGVANGSNVGPDPAFAVAGNMTLLFDPQFGRDFTGGLDEFRVANVERSADWLLTEYNNQNSPSTFYTVGAAAGAVSSFPAAVINNPVVL